MTDAQKTKKFSVYFTGAITALTPYANSPSECKKDMPGGAGTLRMLPRLAIMGPNGFVKTPVISSSALRGPIRRAASRIVLNRMKAADEKISFDDWVFWTVGGAKDSGASPAICARARLDGIDRNPLLSAFGAGDSGLGGMVGGRFQIDTAVPSEPFTIEEIGTVRLARRAEDRNHDLADYLDADELEKVSVYAGANAEKSEKKKDSKKLEREMKNLAKKLRDEGKRPSDNAEYTDLEVRVAAIKAEEEALGQVAKGAASGNSIGMIQPGFETLPQGTVFKDHRLTLKSSTMVQIGFILETLAHTALEDVTFGAHASSGMGRLRMEYNIEIREEGTLTRTPVGSIVVAPGEFVLTGPFLEAALEAWQEAEFVPDDFRKSKLEDAKVQAKAARGKGKGADDDAA